MKKALFLASLSAAAAAGYGYLNRTRRYDLVAPALRNGFSRFRTPTIGPAVLQVLRLVGLQNAACVPGVSLEKHRIASADGAQITVYVYRPEGVKRGGPVMMHTHGGGMVAGSARHFHTQISGYARDLGMVIVTTEYRLAPEHPFPTPIDDIHAAYRWIVAQADDIGIDIGRIVVAGESAGGGLTAGLCQLLLDAGDPAPVLQILIYPMLDDRTCLRPAPDYRGQIGWTPKSNLFGWTSYLGRPPRMEDAPDYAAPARRRDVSGLPPAWIGVGTLDLFYDEDREYADRLLAAGVDCEFQEVEGAYHGFDVMVDAADISRAFRESFFDAARKATMVKPKRQSE